MSDSDLRQAAIAAAIKAETEQDSAITQARLEEANRAYRQLKGVFPTLEVTPEGLLRLVGKEWVPMISGIGCEGASYGLADGIGNTVWDLPSLGRYLQRREQTETLVGRNWFERLFLGP